MELYFLPRIATMMTNRHGIAEMIQMYVAIGRACGTTESAERCFDLGLEIAGWDEERTSPPRIGCDTERWRPKRTVLLSDVDISDRDGSVGTGTYGLALL